jgi:hypothetical protein
MSPEVLDYGRLVMTREVLQASAVAERMTTRFGGLASIDNRQLPVSIPVTILHVSGAMLPSGYAWGPCRPTGWPTFHLEWPLSPSSELLMAAQLQTPLTRAGLPPYVQTEAALFDFLYGVEAQRPGQHFTSCAMFDIADKRARLQEPDVEGGALDIAVDIASGAAVDGPFTLQATWTGDGGQRHHQEHKVSDSRVIHIKTEMDEVDEYFVVLLDPAGEWCDEKRQYARAPRSAFQPALVVPWASEPVTSNSGVETTSRLPRDGGGNEPHPPSSFAPRMTSSLLKRLGGASATVGLALFATFLAAQAGGGPDFEIALWVLGAALFIVGVATSARGWELIRWPHLSSSEGERKRDAEIPCD